MRLGEGDILVFRTGHHARRLALGPWNNEPAGEGKAELFLAKLALLMAREIGDAERVKALIDSAGRNLDT